MAIAPVELPLPRGFRFHPTDQELVNFYLKPKILLDVDDFIPEVDLYKYDPWELADKSFSPCRDDDPDDDEGPKVEEWYLFGPRGRKYGTNGHRMNRATPAGFWKSTGKDRPVLRQRATIGYKKTLVYHLGRAPSGKRTIWVMHEYRLHQEDMTAIQDTCALCRVFKKKTVTPPLDVPRDAAAGEESVLGGAEADKDVPRGAAPDRDGMQFVHCGADADEDGMHLVPGDANEDEEVMPFVPGDAEADEDGMPFVPGGVNADNDNSWMQFIFDDAWYSSVDANMNESWMQFISVGADANMDGSWMQFVTEQQELLGAAAGPSGEAVDVEVARVDDGAAGLELVGRGAEGGGQEEDEE